MTLSVTDVNGNTNAILAPGTTSADVDLWATVTGDGSGNGRGNGLEYLGSNVIVTKSAGVGNATGLTGYSWAGAFNTGFNQPGLNVDLNGDGTLDFGNVGADFDSPNEPMVFTPALTCPMYYAAYYDQHGNPLPQYGPPPTIVGDSTKFLVGTYQLDLTGGVSGRGTINVAAQIPPYIGGVGKFIWFEDNPAPDNDGTDWAPYRKSYYWDGNSSNTGDVTIGASVTFTIASLLPGDADENGTVNGADLNTVLSNFNQTGPGGDAGWRMGDFDGNGTVNGADLNAVLSNFNKTSAVTAAVPEPGTSSLLALGAIGVLAWNGWRKRP